MHPVPRRAPRADGGGHEAALARVLRRGVLAPPPRRAGAQTLPTSDECRTCHLGLADDSLSAPAKSYESDIHAEVGLGCLACHGSGGTDTLDPAAGFLSRPGAPEDPRALRPLPLRRRVHAPVRPEPAHGPGLRVLDVRARPAAQAVRRPERGDVHRLPPGAPDPAARRPSSTVYATNIVHTCGRCHADPDRMAQYGIPTDQVAKYSQSVHGKLLLEDGDVSAPVCNDCHGNHGAAPPGLASVRNVCGQCHTVMAGFFDQSGHEEIFKDNGLPGCVTCHQHHAIQPVSDTTLRVREVDVCQTCHAPPDTLGLQFDRMADLLDSLQAAKDSSQAILEEAQNWAWR